MKQRKIRWRNVTAFLLAICMLLQSVLADCDMTSWAEESDGDSSTIEFVKIQLFDKEGNLLAESNKRDDSTVTLYDTLASFPEVSLTEPILLRYEFILKDGRRAGDHVNFSLPEEIGIYNPLNFNITDEEYRLKFAKVEVDTDGEVNFSLLDKATHEGIDGGWFEIETFWKLDDLEDTQDKTLDFKFNDESLFPPVTLSVSPAQIDSTVEIEKKGQILDSGEIQWSIEVTPHTTPIVYPIRKVTVTDVIPEDQTLVEGSTEILDVASDELAEPVVRAAYGLYGSGSPVEAATFSNARRATFSNASYSNSDVDETTLNLPEYQAVEEDAADGFTVTGNTVKYQFLALTKPSIIRFRTVPNSRGMEDDQLSSDGKIYYFKNRASVQYPADASKPLENPITKTADGAVDYPITYISKDGELVEKGSQIQWTVSVNPSRMELNDAPVVQDIFQSDCLILDEESVSFEPSDGGSIALPLCPDNDSITETTLSGRSVVLCPHDGAHYTYFDYGGKMSICYRLADGDPASGKLRYRTDIDDEKYGEGDQDISNQASMYGKGGWYSPVTATVIKPAKGWITKKAISYNSSTHQITWQARLNQNHQALKGASFQDPLSLEEDDSNAQRYVDGSFRLLSKPDDFAEDGDRLSVTIDGTTQLISYAIGDTDGEFQVEFKTELVNPDAYQDNDGGTAKKYSNTATLKAKFHGREIAETSTATIDTPSTMLRKTGVDYDHATHVLTWEININDNQTKIENAVLKDTLPSELEWFNRDDMDQTFQWKDDNKPGKCDISLEGQVLTLSLADEPAGSDTSKKYTLIVKTRINDDAYNELFSENNGTVRINNHAKLTGDNGIDVSVDSHKDITNSIIGKEAIYEAGQDLVTFRVLINQHKQGISIRPDVNLNTVRLVDRLVDGLTLDYSSVKLYKITGEIQADGSYNLVDAYANEVDLTYGVLAADGTANGNICYDVGDNAFVLHLSPSVTDGFHVATDGDGAILSGQSYLLEFDADIDPKLAAGGEISNTIEFLGTSLERAAGSSGEKHVQYSLGNGGGTGRKGAIRVVKKDKYDSNIRVDNTEFTLQNVDDYFAGLGLEPVSAKTDEKGEALFPMLLYETKYQLKEKMPNPDYLPGGDIVGTEGSPEGTFILHKRDLQGGLMALEVVNTPKLGFIELKKKSSKQDKLLKDAEITVYKVSESGSAEKAYMWVGSEDSKTKKPAVGMTDEDGRVKFDGLRCGNYYMVETKAPEGYRLDATRKIYFKITDNGVRGTYTDSGFSPIAVGGDGIPILENDPTGSVRIEKQNIENPSQRLPGATFGLFATMESAQAATADNLHGGIKGVTGSDGICSFDKLTTGNYYVKELKAPANYGIPESVDGGIQMVELRSVLDPITGKEQLLMYQSDAEISALVYKNMPRGNVTINLKDVYSKMPVDGAVVRIKNKSLKHSMEGDSFPPEGISGTVKNGKVVFENLPLGEYAWEEETIPDGYVAVDDYNYDGTTSKSTQGTFKITSDNYTQHPSENIDFYNRPVLAGYRLLKTDDGESRLNDIEFTLFTDEACTTKAQNEDLGGRTSSVVSRDGEVKFQYLRPGTYYCKETTVNEYYGTAPVFSFIINKDSRLDKTVINDAEPREIVNWRMGKHTIRKVDSKAPYPLIASPASIRIVAVNEDESPTPATGDRAYDETLETIDGVITENLKIGWYYFEEITAPDGYLREDGKHYFEVSHQDDGEQSGTVSDLKNRQLPSYNLKITKTGEPGNRPLAGAVIGVYDEENVLVKSQTTGADGTVLFEKLLCDKDYYYKEISAPRGYSLDENKYPFTLSDDGSDGDKLVEKTLNNKLQRGSFRFQKTDSSHSATPLAGAEFELQYMGAGTSGAENPWGTAGKKLVSVSGEDGLVAFENLPLGIYTCREIKAPVGYHLESAWSYQAELTALKPHARYLNSDGNEIGFVNFGLYQGSLEVTKTDENEIPLAGAEFGVYLSSNDQMVTSGVTDENGKLVFEALYEGAYYLKEIQAPEDYLTDPNTHPFVIDRDGQKHEITVENKRIPRGDFHLTKVARGKQTPLAGAVISVYQKDGTLIGQKETGADGRVSFERLVLGNYYYEETKAPAGYERNTKKHEFTLSDEGQQLEVKLENSPHSSGGGGGNTTQNPKPAPGGPGMPPENPAPVDPNDPATRPDTGDTQPPKVPTEKEPDGSTSVVVPELPPQTDVSISNSGKEVVYQGKTGDTGRLTLNLPPDDYTLVAIDDQGVPLGSYQFSIEDNKIPLAGLPKTGDPGVTPLGSCLMFAILLGSCGLAHRKRRMR